MAFCAEFLTLLWLAPDRLAYATRAWFNLAIIVLSPPFLAPEAFQAARGLRAVRLLRLVRLIRAGAIAAVGLRTARRLLKHRDFHYVLLVALIAIGLGTLGIYLIEGGTTVHSLDDALWWSLVTVSTVGYGDVAPKTGEERIGLPGQPRQTAPMPGGIGRDHQRVAGTVTGQGHDRRR